MATTNLQLAEGPDTTSIAVYNASTTTDIPAYRAVIVDASNILDNALTKNQLAVTLPTDTTNPSVIIGFTRTIIPAGGSGRLIPAGPVTLAVCKGAVTAGTFVDNSVTASYTGMVATHTAGKNQCGIALATGADGDTIPVLLAVAVNA